MAAHKGQLADIFFRKGIRHPQALTVLPSQLGSMFELFKEAPVRRTVMVWADSAVRVTRELEAVSDFAVRVSNKLNREYITAFKEQLDARRLSRAGTELFARIYKNPVVFPFDGFSTARGNAADSCQELTSELLVGKLDYDAVMGKPIRVKNRAISVLKNSWGIFAKNGSIRTRPSQPVLRTLTEKWDEMLSSGERRIPVGKALQQICAPPYGANIASAGLFLGVFVAPRVDKLSVHRNGQSYAISQWLRDGIFRGKFLDLGGLHGAELVLLGEESTEWEILLDEWEQAKR